MALCESSTLSDVLAYVCDNLPEDWRLDVRMENDAGSVDLTNPDGDDVEFCDDDLTLVQMIVRRVSYARQSDGLQATDDCCEHGTPEFGYCEKCNADYKRAAKEAGHGD